MSVAPVTTQPQGGTDPSSEVTVRYMTAEDSAFVARWLILGFRDKCVWNVGESNLENFIELMTDSISKRPPEAYRSTLVAEYQGRLAGLAGLHFHNQPDYDDLNSGDFCRRLGCCATLGLMRFFLWVPKPKEGELLLDQLVVMEGFRGKGIGKALLNAVDNRAREDNLKTVFLWVAYGNRAKNLYERHGYEEVEFYDGCCRTWCAVGVRKFHRMVKTP